MSIDDLKIGLVGGILVKQLPAVKKIHGLSLGLGSNPDYVELEYLSEDEETCVIALSLDQAMEMEEYFIKIRNHLAGRNLQKRKGQKQALVATD